MDFFNVERRAYARVSAAIMVRIASPDGTFDEFITKDISMGGVFIQTDYPRNIGEKLDLMICYADGQEEIAVFGEVARLVGFDQTSMGVPGPRGIGIRFIIVEPSLQDQLEQFLSSLLELKGAGQREHQRIKARIKLKLKTEGKDQYAVLDNISKGGLYLETTEDFSILDRIEVALIHPQTSQQIEIVGEVIHKRESLDVHTNAIRRGVGVRFVELSEEKEKSIVEFIKSIVENTQG